ncbi:hypothetical protein [Hymenobacter sp. APR13]|uniref:hypothetical protein n=1 Tax=Hymenobacter sp. APR13 TaxID=1356852 RepID=UPI0004E0AE0E|nr:hypothetical protein [Hymenobacter sp. APR13]AII50846.1 hypothetical protein N008_02475 [Hymenobacter sp. APR13]
MKRNKTSAAASGRARRKAYLQPPAELPGTPTHYERRPCYTRRLHNRRITVLTTPTGGYQVKLAVVLPPGQAAELRRQGHHDSMQDYILRDRVRYSVVTLSAEAFEAMVWCWAQLRERQQRKRA